MCCNESRYLRLTDNGSRIAVAELDREEVVGTRFAIVSDADGETNFGLNCRMKIGSKASVQASTNGCLPFKLVTFVTPLNLFCRVI